MKKIPKFSQEVLDACGRYEDLHFEPVRYRNRNGAMLVIDDNFRLFCMPYHKTMDYELLTSTGRILERGMVVNRPGKNSFRLAIQCAEEYLSKAGTMCTYGSINLKTKTGVGPFTG